MTVYFLKVITGDKWIYKEERSKQSKKNNK